MHLGEMYVQKFSYIWGEADILRHKIVNVTGKICPNLAYLNTLSEGYISPNMQRNPFSGEHYMLLIAWFDR